MSYLKVDLSGVSKAVRDGFKELTHVSEGTSADVIIVAATHDELVRLLSKLQLQASAQDTTYQYPNEMLEISPDAIIEGRTVRERFNEALLV